MNIYEICKEGDLNRVNSFITQGNIQFNWNNGLAGACIEGHLEIVNLMISKGANDWNFGLYWACKGGHLEIIELMISKGANDWNFGLYYSCKGAMHPSGTSFPPGGHLGEPSFSSAQERLEIVNLMISKGANDWNWGFEGACEGGHLEIVNLMISKGANNWNLGLYRACEGGHLEIVNLMISKGANNWNLGLYRACEGGHLEIVNLIISKGATENTIKKYVSKEIAIKLLYLNKNDKLKVIEGIPKHLDFLLKERKVFKEYISFIIKDLNNLILNFLYL